MDNFLLHMTIDILPHFFFPKSHLDDTHSIIIKQIDDLYVLHIY